MTLTRRATSRDWRPVKALLGQCDLPMEGAAEHLGNFLLAFDGERMIACAGLEYYGNAALLRSVAVQPGNRGRGVGKALVTQLLAMTAQRNIENVALLSTTAADYFPRMGFTAVARDSLPHGVMASAEFKGACPDTATAMMLRLPEKGDDL